MDTLSASEITKVGLYVQWATTGKVDGKRWTMAQANEAHYYVKAKALGVSLDKAVAMSQLSYASSQMSGGSGGVPSQLTQSSDASCVSPVTSQSTGVTSASASMVRIGQLSEWTRGTLCTATCRGT